MKGEENSLPFILLPLSQKKVSSFLARCFRRRRRAFRRLLLLLCGRFFIETRFKRVWQKHATERIVFFYKMRKTKKRSSFSSSSSVPFKKRGSFFLSLLLFPSSFLFVFLGNNNGYRPLFRKTRVKKMNNVIFLNS